MKSVVHSTVKELVHWGIAASISIVITVIGVTLYHFYHNQPVVVTECPK